MTVPLLILFAYVVLLGGWVAWALCVAAPRALRSMYRYKLWQMRDDLWDAIQAGRFADTQAPLRLLEGIERAIASSEKMTLLTLFLVPTLPPSDRPTWDEEVARARSMLDDESFEMFQTVRFALRNLTCRHLFLGSFIGWVFALPLAAVTIGAVAVYAVKVMLHRGVRHAVARAAAWKSVAWSTVDRLMGSAMRRWLYPSQREGYDGNGLPC